MKIFIVLFGLLLFGFINLKSAVIHDLDVGTEYTFVTGYTHYYFRVKVSNLVNMYLELSAFNVEINSKADFKLDICGFYDYPSDNEVMYGHEYCANANIPSLDKRNDKVYYNYTWTTLEDINYLAFSLTTMKNNLYPYTLYIYSEKAENTESTEKTENIEKTEKTDSENKKTEFADSVVEIAE